MKKKEIREIINDELECIYHTQEKKDYYKRGLLFNKVSNSLNYNKLKFGLIGAFCMVTLICSGSALIITKQHQSDNTTFEMINHDINNYATSRCDYLLENPKSNFTLEENYYFYLYEGRKYDKENRNHEIIYFYQFGKYGKETTFNFTLDFYYLEKHEIIALTENTVGMLSLNEKQSLTDLYVDIYKSDILINSYFLI